MAGTYYNISESEMDGFLTTKGFKRISHLPNTVELVYGKRVDQDGIQMTLRVYTGINPDGQSREAGTDAMRVNLFMRTADGRTVKLGGSKRVHRIKTWEKNLGARIASWLDYMPSHGKCDKCDLPMIPRKGTNGEFLGCAGYPDCKNTRQSDGEI